MRSLISVLIFVFSGAVFASVSNMQCEVVDGIGVSTGQTLLFGAERAFIVGPAGIETIVFNEEHLCGTLNTVPGTKLRHMFVDASKDTQFRINVVGDTHIVRSELDIRAGKSYQFSYGKKETSSNIGQFACGDWPELADIQLQLKECKELQPNL